MEVHLVESSAVLFSVDSQKDVTYNLEQDGFLINDRLIEFLGWITWLASREATAKKEEPGQIARSMIGRERRKKNC